MSYTHNSGIHPVPGRGPGGPGRRGAPVAVITGASRGLGRALAHSLAAAGYLLVIDARDKTALTAVAASLPAGSVTAVAGDVTDPAHRDLLRRSAIALGGP